MFVVVLAHPAGPAFRFEDPDAIAGGALGLLPLGLAFLRAAGVGQAGVDGVVQVEPLAVPGRDDRLGRDAGVVAVFDRAVRLGEGGALRDGRAVGRQKATVPSRAAAIR
jgi:hypothetical protein